jgi:hypothetical protein
VINRTGEQWDLPVLAHEDSIHARVLRPRGVRRAARANAAGCRRRHPETVISRLNIRPARTPLSTFRCALTGRQRITRGHRASLLLRCRAFSSLSSCRFIPALSTASHGLRRDSRGSALSYPLTTRQASLYAADRSVAPTTVAFDAGLRPDPFPDRAASLPPGFLATTRTGLSPAGDDELPIRS